MMAAHQFLMLARTEEHPIRTVSSTRATSSRGSRTADYAVAERGGRVGHRGRRKGKGKGREREREREQRGSGFEFAKYNSLGEAGGKVVGWSGEDRAVKRRRGKGKVYRANIENLDEGQRERWLGWFGEGSFDLDLILRTEQTRDLLTD